MDTHCRVRILIMVTKRRTISATEARVHFGELMRRARAEGPITVERGGAPQVVVMSVEQYARLKSASGEATEEPWEIKAREARRMFREHLKKTGAKLPDAVEIIREGREIRDRQIDEATGLYRREPGHPAPDR